MLESKTGELIPGGLAKGMPDSAFNKYDLEEGIKVELEHTTSRSIAKEIAKDHLKEDPKYYTKLKKMESKDTQHKTTSEGASRVISINETPDKIESIDASWHDEGNITFTLIDDYYIYDKLDLKQNAKPTHSHLAIYLAYLCDKEKYADNFRQVSSLFKSIKSNLPDDWCKSDIAQSILKIIEDEGSIDRGKLLKHFSARVIQGRLWPDQKAVSFWGNFKNVYKHRNKIIKFISNFDDPKVYKYDVNNVLFGYNDFITGNHKADNNQQYTDVLHLLPAQQKREKLLAMGAKPKVQSPLAYKYAAFGESLNKALDELLTSEFRNRS